MPSTFGTFGGSVVDQWIEFNDRYFDGELHAIPIVLTHAQPFGKRLAFCSHSPGTAGRTITLNVPANHRRLVADANTLLHEMVHQHLFENGEDAQHAGAGWRREIMRLNKAITGRDIWAGRSKTVRDPNDPKRVIRTNEAGDGDVPSITQRVIARWPHDDVGIDLGRLGAKFDR